MTIVTPPENTTVCRGSNGTVICGYQSDIPVNVSWIINGASPILDTDLSSYRYQLNNVDDTLNYSLTLLNVDYNTTFQCIVESTENTTMSTLGRVTVIGKCVYTYVIMHVIRAAKTSHVFTQLKFSYLHSLIIHVHNLHWIMSTGLFFRALFANHVAKFNSALAVEI